MTAYIVVYYSDKIDEITFGSLDNAFLSFDKAKKAVIQLISAELQSARINGRRLTSEEINTRLSDAEKTIGLPGDDYLSDYACCFFGVRHIKLIT